MKIQIIKNYHDKENNRHLIKNQIFPDVMKWYGEELINKKVAKNLDIETTMKSKNIEKR